MVTPVGKRVELPEAEYDNECSISLESLRDLAKRKDLVATPCGHKFSSVSITDWLKRTPECPVCRRALAIEAVVPVILKPPTAKEINGALTEDEALEVAIRLSREEAITPIRYEEVKEFHFSNTEQYEVVLMHVHDKASDTFKSRNLFADNRPVFTLQDARPGDRFTVPGFFLNDWNFRMLNDRPLYLFALTKDDPLRRDRLIKQGQKIRNAFGSESYRRELDTFYRARS